MTEASGYGAAACRRCKVQAAFCPCDHPDIGLAADARAWAFYWWHNFRVTRWLCPTCRKLDRLEAEDASPE
jgi:hypothetical protein